MARTARSIIPIKLPSREQAALALAIIHLKPSNLSVREYVLQLRAHIRQRTNCNIHPPTSTYLDLVAYWRDQCRQIQDECNRLHSLNIKLERSAYISSTRVEPLLADSNETVTMAPTRKARAVSPVRTAKRPQRKAAQSSVAETQDTVESDFDLLDALGDDGASLTEALFTTHRLCRATRLDPDTLCLSLIKTSSALGKVIRVVAWNYEQLSRRGQNITVALSSDQDKSDFSMALSVCARAFIAVLIGTDKLTGSNADNRMPSLVICELVAVFKCALDAIQALTQQTAQRVNLDSIQLKKGKAETKDRRLKECPAARAIVHLLIGFLGFLDKTNTDHQKLFDGFVFVLLERVGKQLYYCTFGRHRSTTIEANILSAPEAKDATKNTKPDCAELAIHLEVKALVLILERTMGLAPNHMNPQTSRTVKTPDLLTRTLSIKNLATNSRARLSPIAKARLQRTLITCMYGDAVEDEFLDVLTKPVPAMRLGSLQDVAKIEDKNVKEWYKQEIWRLVGWDVLAKEGGW